MAGVGCLHLIDATATPMNYDHAKTRCNDEQNGFPFEFDDFEAEQAAVAQFISGRPNIGVTSWSLTHVM